jgi:hypothetical protein
VTTSSEKIKIEETTLEVDSAESSSETSSSGEEEEGDDEDDDEEGVEVEDSTIETRPVEITVTEIVEETEAPQTPQTGNITNLTLTKACCTASASIHRHSYPRFLLTFIEPLTTTTRTISTQQPSSSTSTQLSPNETLPVSIPDETTVNPDASEETTLLSTDEAGDKVHANETTTAPPTSTVSLEGVDYKQSKRARFARF